MEVILKAEKYTDTDIIRNILNGETALFEILIRRNNPVLYKVGRTCNFSHEDTEDLMQDTFIDAFLSLDKFEGRSSFRTWIIKIMLNNCYRKSQKAGYKNEKAKEIPDTSIPAFSAFSNDTNNTVMNGELGSIIEKALVKMPQDYKMVFSLREMTGLNVSETAEALKISEANVRVRLNRAKALLRKEIEKSYSPEEIFEFNLIYCDRMVERVMRKISANVKDM
ncbi:MAG TPA: sigma-70 family RNA polymerase sigma factor [Bacteroidales bacterium]|jgi:RNA polymerase sigma-70 factor (ECF subfamily)|nr:sigma-70 family RNA polymerase sigma factor [Bacteroidales bacterium]